VSWYQKGKTNLDFTEARDSELLKNYYYYYYAVYNAPCVDHKDDESQAQVSWWCHQLGHMQVCTLLQADNHASTPLLSFYRPDELPAAQPTASKH